MTDLISSIADSIVALINASPRSPTKEEIEEVLRTYHEKSNPLISAALDAGMGPGFPSLVMPLPYKDVSPAFMELMAKTRADIRSVTGIDNLPRNCQNEAPNAGVASPLTIQLLEYYQRTFEARQPKVAANYQLPAVSKAMLDAMNAIRKSSYEPGRAQHMLPCDGSTDGSHFYNPHCTKEGVMFYRCACGATKP